MPVSPKKPGRAAIEARVLEILSRQLKEMSAHRALQGLNAKSSLERDLGLDSLSRAELVTRLEREFGVDLPGSALMDCQTPADLASLLARSRGRLKPRGVGGKSVTAAKASAAPEKARTLPEVLRYRAQNEPDRSHIVLRADDESESEITFGELLAESRAMAAGLTRGGLSRGETCAIMLATGREFFVSFFGVLLAGAIPVPIYPPFRADRVGEYVSRQSAILANAGVRTLITFAQVKGVARALAATVKTLREVITPEALAARGRRPGGLPEAAGPGEPALIQYTSGSTGVPKGVVLTHTNLLANIRSLGTAAGFGPADAVVSWLPLYHDMGLIGAWLGALYHGLPVTIMPPLSFIARPQRWLWAIHAHRATITAAPNFAYELCASRVPEEALTGLDLSCLRVMFNGAEPVSPDTLERFGKRFARYGFKPQAMCPVYGLAENSLALTCPVPGRGPRIDVIARGDFASRGRARPASTKDVAPLKIVSCGRPIPGHEIRLLNRKGRAIEGERIVGRLQFRGPSSTSGYYRPAPDAPPLIEDGWVNSGDLAYLAAGEIHIAGRSKDLIIRGGRNLAPQELEESASAVSGVRRGCVAAFGLHDREAGTEKVVIVAETRETAEEARRRIRDEITNRITDAVGVPPDVVELAPPGAVPKTSSGKVGRSACKDAYVAGRLGRRRLPVWLQVGALSVTALTGRLARLATLPLRIAYAAYLGLLLAGMVFLLLAALALVPASRPARGRGLLGVWSRVFLALSGVRLAIHGAEKLRGEERVVLVANHASYSDALVLAAALRTDFVFLAKSELLANFFIGPVLRKLKHLTVDRLDPGRAEIARDVARALKEETSVLIFPEGTFSAATGVRPFALGAFRAAIASGKSVRPVAIRGTRRILRGGEILPRPGRVEILVGDLLRPAGKGWKAEIRLRDQAKAEIVKLSGEPALDLTSTGRPDES